MNITKAAKNFLYSVLSQIITIGLGLVIPRLVMLSFGSETNGLLNSVTQLMAYLNLFEAGVNMVAEQSLYNPVSMDDKESISRILSAVHISYKKTGVLYLGMLLILAVVYPYTLPGSDLRYWTVFGVVFFSGLGNVVLFFFQGKYKILLQAEGKSYIVTNLQTIISVLKNIAKILCIAWGYDIVAVVAVSFAVSMIQAVYICLLMRRKYSWIDLKSPPEYGAISQRNFALMHQVAGMVFYNTDVLIITFFCGLKVASVYSVYKLVTSHLSSILYNFYGSISFALGQKFNSNKVSFIKLIDTVDVYFGGVCFAIYTVAAALLFPFIELYTRGVTDIEYAEMNLCLLFVAIELLTFLRMPMLNTIKYAGHFKNTLPQSMVETAINLIVSLTTVKSWGIFGVLMGTIAALFYRDTEILLYTNHKILNRSAKKTFCIYGIDVAICVLMLIAVNSIPLFIRTYVDFVKVGLILTPISLIVYMFILSFFFRDEKRVIIQIAHKVIHGFR